MKTSVLNKNVLESKTVMWELKSVFGGFEMFKGIKLVVQSVQTNKPH